MIPYRGKPTIQRTIKYIEDNMSYNWIDSLKSFDTTNLKFRLDEESLSEVILKLVENHIHPGELSFVLKICESLNLSVANKENKQVFDEILDLYVKNISRFPNNENFDKLMSSFNDKKIALEYLKYIYSNKQIDEVYIINCFIDYVIKARQYYVDDRALLSSAIEVLNSIDESDLQFGHQDVIKKATERKIIDDRKSNGVYDIDQFTLEELDRKHSELESLFDSLEGLSQMADQQIDLIRKETQNSNSELTDSRIKTLKLLKTESNKILTNFRTQYLELLNKEKENIINQRDILIAEMDTEFQKRKLELEALASNIGERIVIELGRIRNVSDYSMEQIQNFVSNNEEIKKMIEVAKTDEAVLSKLSKLDKIPVQQLSSPSLIQSSPIAVPSIVIPKPERKIEEKINYYFDPKIPFKDRFNELMQKKQEDIEKTGAIYHEKFDDLVTFILNNNTPYMYGPSGCGKTYMIEQQLAKLLELDVVTNGYVMYESDILGFNNANGVYVPSNFYRCYKFGDIIFFDELDNSNSASTIVLNSFIGKGVNSAYTFPDGDRIERHPNFRILTAGNTRGNGRTVSHNTRTKLDEAVMQRLTPIEIDYDNRIEEKILKDYPDWFNFAINFREALKNLKIEGSDGVNYNGTITTRDIESIKRYKDDNSFSDEKIIQYEVIENKDSDYLNQILREMEELEINGKFTKESAELLEKFKVLSKQVKY